MAIKVLEYDSWTETLPWLAKVWVCDIPTIIRIWTDESEKGKYFSEDIETKTVTIVDNVTKDAVPDVAGSFFVLEILDGEKTNEFPIDEEALHLAARDIYYIINPVCECVYRTIVSEEDGTFIISYKDKETSEEIVRIKTLSFKKYLEVWGYKKIDDETFLKIEHCLATYLGLRVNNGS